MFVNTKPTFDFALNPQLLKTAVVCCFYFFVHLQYYRFYFYFCFSTKFLFINDFSAKHINDLQGSNGKEFTADKFVKYPFTFNFEIENCVCVCFSIIKNENYNSEIVSFKIDYFSQFTQDSYDRNSLDIGGFFCNGVLIIHPKNNDYEEIITCLKENPWYYKEKASDCLTYVEESNKNEI